VFYERTYLRLSLQRADIFRERSCVSAGERLYSESNENSEILRFRSDYSYLRRVYSALLAWLLR